MCELFGMSANLPTDICFSFSGLRQRGGRTGPHQDGFGVAFYEGKGCRAFHDPFPSSTSEIADFIRHYPIHSTKVICHIRKANRGRVCLENTHPFIRVFWGRNWCFAHNGQLKGVKKALVLKKHLPVGTTDSEHVFCWILEQLELTFDKPPKNSKDLWAAIEALAVTIRQFGVFNFLLSDSKFLYAHCSTKLVWITRRAPFGQAKLVDEDLEVDFSEVFSETDVISVIATQPLTSNEVWEKCKRGDFLVFQNGLIKYKNF